MVDFHKILTHNSGLEKLLDDELKEITSDLSLDLLNISQKLYDFTTSNTNETSLEFNQEVSKIRERIKYLYILTDSCSRYDRANDPEYSLRMLRLGVIYACNDFYHRNSKTLASRREAPRSTRAW